VTYIINPLGLKLKRLVINKNKFCIKSNAPEWTKRPNEIVIEDDTLKKPSQSIFDSVSPTEHLKGNDNKLYSISYLTLQEVSEVFHFSLSYLGDYLIQIGCRPPINIDIELHTFINADQMRLLLTALMTLNADDANKGYMTHTLSELASAYNVSVSHVVDTCNKYGFNLPFGNQTILHESVIENLKGIYSS
jgi:hypothetical protein